MCVFSFILTIFVLCPIALMAQTPASVNNITSTPTGETTLIKSDNESSSLGTAEILSNSVPEASSTFPSTSHRDELLNVKNSIEDVWRGLTVKQTKETVTKKSDKLEMNLADKSAAGRIEITIINYVYLCLMTVVAFKLFL